MGRHILILGATSGIARGIAEAFAKRGDNLYLAARDEFELHRIADDLRVKYPVKVTPMLFDIEKTRELPAIDNLDGIVFAIGYMGRDVDKVLSINFTAAVNSLNYYADYFLAKKAGFIVGLSSVAGDRGRQSNYVYGAAKAGLSTYLAGLRNKLAKQQIHVMTVKPGFVDTQMTFGLPGMFLVADPNKVGEKIVKAIDKKTDVLYVPWFWRYIMLIIKSIPERVFKRLSL